MIFSSWRAMLPLCGQFALMLTGLAGLYAFPPLEGRMMLVPLTDHARAALLPVAVEHGARLVARGPISGSMLVEGRRDRLADPLLRDGVLLLAARAGGCGADL